MSCPSARWQMADIEGLCDEAKAVMQRVAPLNDLVIKNMFADLEGGIRTRGAKADGDPVSLEEDTSEVVLILNHAYAGSRFKLAADDIGSCLRLAAKYDMPRLSDACHKYLDKVQLTASTLPAWLEAACGYSVPRFTERCVQYAAGKLQSIIDQREEEQLQATDWLEELPPSMLVEMMQFRTRTLATF